MQFGPGFAATFLYYFTSTAVIVALVASRSLHVGFDTGIPQEFGAVSGTVVGLVSAFFNRTASFSVPAKNPKAVLTQLSEVLSQMGYQQTQELEDNIAVYERSALSKFFSGRVFVQREADQITIATRALQLRAIRKRLSP